jgi:lysozyme
MSVSARVLWRRTRIGAGFALALALIGLCFWLFAANWRPAVQDFPVQGIDISERQGPIDWWKVKEGGTVDFAYARATDGARGHDRRFEEYWKGMFETDIPHGAIHAFSLCRLAADQAGNFAATVPAKPDLLPMALELDFEPRCAARPARDVVIGEISRFLVAVEAYTGKRAILKITRRFDAYYRVSEAIERPLWAVQPFFPPSYFDKRWTIWQSSSFRRVEGVAKPVNWDVMTR